MSWRQQATTEQISMLLDFLKENKDLARGLLRGPDARVRTKRLWEDITQQLNSVGGAHKTSAQWQKVWADRKHCAKKMDAQRRRDHFGTGGGPAGPQLTQTHAKILEIMGKDFGGPQTDSRVPAFLNDENQLTLGEQVEEEVLLDDHDYCSSPPHAFSHSDQQMVSRSPLAPLTASFTHSDNTTQQQGRPNTYCSPTAAVPGSATHSAWQEGRPNTCSPLTPAAAITSSATHSARRQEQPNTCSPTPSTVATTSSARRRVRDMGRRTMRAQPNVAGRLLQGEREKGAALDDIKHSLKGIEGQMATLNNNLVELMAFLKEKHN